MEGIDGSRSSVSVGDELSPTRPLSKERLAAERAAAEECSGAGSAMMAPLVA